MYVLTRMADTEGSGEPFRKTFREVVRSCSPQTSCGTTRVGENRLFLFGAVAPCRQRLDAGVLYAIRDKLPENFAIIAAKYMIMKNLRFFLLALMSAALLWACGGDEGGEPAPEPSPGPGVGPQCRGDYERFVRRWTRQGGRALTSTTAARSPSRWPRVMA